MVTGVFLGSAIWWVILSNGIHAVKARFGNGSLKFVNWTSGGILIAFALLAFYSLR